MLHALDSFKLDTLESLKASELTESNWYDGIHELGFSFEGYEMWLNIPDDDVLSLLDIKTTEDSDFTDQENFRLIVQHMCSNLDDVSIYYDTNDGFRKEVLDKVDLYDMLLSE